MNKLIQKHAWDMCVAAKKMRDDPNNAVKMMEAAAVIDTAKSALADVMAPALGVTRDNVCYSQVVIVVGTEEEEEESIFYFKNADVAQFAVDFCTHEPFVHTVRMHTTNILNDPFNCATYVPIGAHLIDIVTRPEHDTVQMQKLQRTITKWSDLRVYGRAVRVCQQDLGVDIVFAFTSIGEAEFLSNFVRREARLCGIDIADASPCRITANLARRVSFASFDGFSTEIVEQSLSLKKLFREFSTAKRRVATPIEKRDRDRG